MERSPFVEGAREHYLCYFGETWPDVPWESLGLIYSREMFLLSVQSLLP
jgi:hypothetical protein